MEVIKINDTEYYNCEDLNKLDSEFFKNCNGRLRTIIDWKKIDDTNYVYAYEKDNKWILSTIKYPRSKLLLKKSYCVEHIPKLKPAPIKKVNVTLKKTNPVINKKNSMTENKNQINKLSKTTNKLSNKISPLPIEKKIIINKTNNTISNKNENKEENKKQELLPELIILSEEEKFKDINGNSINIEVRGIRDYDKIFFKLKDIAIEFEMPNIRNTIFDKNNKTYHENLHYKIFVDENNNKHIYLTYKGLLKILFIDKDNRTKEFNIIDNLNNIFSNIEWICNKRLKSKYRPDMYTIIDDFILMIEIDEKQHKNYKINKENERIKKIYDELNKKNMTLIRINPDSYIDCYDIEHKGISNNPNIFNMRMNIIIKTVEESLKNKKEGLNIIKLFFDKYEFPNIIDNENNFYYSDNNKSIKLRNSFREQLIKKSFFYLYEENKKNNEISEKLFDKNLELLNMKLLIEEKDRIILHKELYIKELELKLACK
jgi:hypothetical protein